MQEAFSSQHGHRLTDELLVLMGQLTSSKERLVRALLDANSELRGNRVPLESLVDISYLLNRLVQEAEHIKKEANSVKQTVDNVACAAWLLASAVDPELSGKMTGHIAAGNPNLQAIADVPSRSSPEYVKLMKWLGATDDMVQHDVLRPHWPHLMDSISGATAEGRPLPPGIDPKSLKTRYALQQLRIKKGVRIGVHSNGEVTVNREG